MRARSEVSPLFRTLFRTALGMALALGVVAAPAHADLSSAADPSWVTNGEVKAAARIGTDVYVGGTFDYVGPFTGNGVVLDTANGLRKSGWPTVEGGQVLAAVPDGSGGWFIGGDFDKVGGQSRLNVAHIRADKTIDPAWNPGTNNAVRAMVVSGGYLYIGGDFTVVAGITNTYSRLAALSVTTGVPRNDWIPTASATVRAMAMATVGGTSYVVIAGSFTTVNSTSHRRLARVRASDGAADGGWLPGVMDDHVNAMAIAGSTVFVAGSFDEFDDPNSSTNLVRHGLGSFDLGTGAPTTWVADVGGGFVNALAYDGVRLYAGGGFTSIGLTSVAGLAAIDPDTAVVDSGWTPDPQVAVGFPNVYALALQGSNLVVGGSFTSIGGQPRDDLATVSRSGNGDAVGTFSPNVMRDENTEVTAVAVSGSDLYVGGDFRSVGGFDRGYLAAFDKDGVATSWNPVADAPVEALAKRGTTLYVGGSFATIAGQAHANLAALDTSGALVAVRRAGRERRGLQPGGRRRRRPALRRRRVHDRGGRAPRPAGRGRPRQRPRARLGALGRRRGDRDRPDVHARLHRRQLHDRRRRVAAQPGGRAAGHGRGRRAGTRSRTAASRPSRSAAAVRSSSAATSRRSAARSRAPTSRRSTRAPARRPPGARTRRAAPCTRCGFATPNLYVGGEFTSIDGTARNRLAAVEVVDGDALSWNPNVTGTSARGRGDRDRARQLRDNEVTPGKLYIGGRFTQIGLLPRGGYAGFNETTDPPSNTVLPGHHGHGAARQHAQLLQRHLDRLADVVHAAVGRTARTSRGRPRRATPCRSPTSAPRSSAG